MAVKEAKIIEVVPQYAAGEAHLETPNNPARALVELERERQEYLARAKDVRLQQVHLFLEHGDNPDVRKALAALSQAALGEAEGEPISIADFFQPSAVEPKAPEKKDLSWMADRSKWSPKLRELIDRLFPEEGREERIRRATERSRSVVLGKGLSPEAVRYYAEDVDLEYDV